MKTDCRGRSPIPLSMTKNEYLDVLNAAVARAKNYPDATPEEIAFLESDRYIGALNALAALLAEKDPVPGLSRFDAVAFLPDEDGLASVVVDFYDKKGEHIQGASIRFNPQEVTIKLTTAFADVALNWGVV